MRLLQDAAHLVVGHARAAQHIGIAAVGTPEAKLRIERLGSADAAGTDMRTLVIIGSSRTRAISRDAAAPWIYTPRSERDIA